MMYGMFSEAGEKAVANVVKFAKQYHLDWTGVEGMLIQLAKNAKYEEATDTAVREAVYCELGFDR